MSSKNTVQINLRVPEGIASDLDRLAEQEHLTRVDVARQILLEGVIGRKRDRALELYRLGKVSKSRAAEIAGVSLWEMIDLIDRTGTPNPYTLQEAVDEVKQITAHLKNRRQ